MMLIEFWHAPIWLSLSVIGGVLGACVGLSLAIPRKVEKPEPQLLGGSADVPAQDSDPEN